MRKILKGAAYLIGGYLMLTWATGAGQLLTTGSTAGVNVIKAFQGRS